MGLRSNQVIRDKPRRGVGARGEPGGLAAGQGLVHASPGAFREPLPAFFLELGDGTGSSAAAAASPFPLPSPLGRFQVLPLVLAFFLSDSAFRDRRDTASLPAGEDFVVAGRRDRQSRPKVVFFSRRLRNDASTFHRDARSWALDARAPPKVSRRVSLLAVLHRSQEVSGLLLTTSAWPTNMAERGVRKIEIAKRIRLDSHSLFDKLLTRRLRDSIGCDIKELATQPDGVQ